MPRILYLSVPSSSSTSSAPAPSAGRPVSVVAASPANDPWREWPAPEPWREWPDMDPWRECPGVAADLGGRASTIHLRVRYHARDIAIVRQLRSPYGTFEAPPTYHVMGMLMNALPASICSVYGR